ncbi:MAG: CehA/McbA family metallohydrolase, partial [Planctomycetota bacterium]|nr:CehA/McbA family metallohydrolase [Planctomycetota bacterium]
SLTYFWPKIIPVLLSLALSHFLDPPRGLGEKVLHLDPGKLNNLRAGSTSIKEWDEFPDHVESSALEHVFDAESNASSWTLSLRQQNVKESWKVVLNEKELGRLVRDENDLRSDFEIPPQLLQEFNNQLSIHATSSKSDDVRVGEIEIHDQYIENIRNQAKIEIVITDSQQQPLPGRITVVDANGTLTPLTPLASSSPSKLVEQKGSVTHGAADQPSDPMLASREGVIYTATGHAYFGVRPGAYRIYASRGFEYSAPTTQLTVGRGQHAKRTLQLAKEVNTEGWVACDTHVHTMTYSGHGDCTLQERLVTLAGEGIELPISTDHNTQIDYSETALALGLSKWFTSVVGNEVTTKNGHFNIFPTAAQSARPNHLAANWQELFDSIFGNPQVKVAILNHARDLHSSFRPFSPSHHISLTGSNLDGFDRRFNAMELINSGAVQTDPMELFRDWCGLINHGMKVTPVGSSDSHDVTRYIVGQGRTYIAADDKDVSKLDTSACVQAFLEGKVIVSYGLFAHLTAERIPKKADNQLPAPQSAPTNPLSDMKKAGPGEILRLGNPQSSMIRLHADLRLPSWSEVTEVELWINGHPSNDAPMQVVAPQVPAGRNQDSMTKLNHQTAFSSTRKSYQWLIPENQFKHDSWVSLVARGPGIRSPHWPTARPYQPDSTTFEGYTFSCTGPIYLDLDGDGQFRSAREIAQSLGKMWLDSKEKKPEDPGTMVLEEISHALSESHASVRDQFAELASTKIEDFSNWMTGLSPTLKSQLEPFHRAWQQSIRARLEQNE